MNISRLIYNIPENIGATHLKHGSKTWFWIRSKCSEKAALGVFPLTIFNVPKPNTNSFSNYLGKKEKKDCKLMF